MRDTVYVCGIFRNESLYLREWIEFHLLVGVNKFFLYNNNSDDDYHSVLDPYIASGIVELIEWPVNPPSQLSAYQHYIDGHRGAYWTAFIDIDEFLFPVRYDTLQKAIPFLPQSAIGVNWICFGSSGKTEWEDAPVTERFTWRQSTDSPGNIHIKSMVWMDQLVRVGSTPHHFNVQFGTHNEYGQPINGPLSYHTSYMIRINHYCTKSYGEWAKRARNGKPDRSHFEPNDAQFAEQQRMDVQDFDIQKFLPQLKERLAQ